MEKGFREGICTW